MRADLAEFSKKRNKTQVEKDAEPKREFSVDAMNDEAMEKIAVEIRAAGGDKDPEADRKRLSSGENERFKEYKHHNFARRWGVLTNDPGKDEEWFIASPPVLSPDDPQYLCEMCRHIDFRALFSQRGLPGNIQAYSSSIQLHGLSRIMNAEHCAFCRLLRKKIERDDLLADHIPQAKEYGSFIMRVLDEGPDYALRIEFELPDVEATHPRFILAQMAEDEPRPLQGLTTSQETANLPRLKKWLDDCDSHHASATTNNINTLVGSTPPTLRFIDIEDNCITEVPTPCAYACLSYVWGQQGSQLQLTTDTRAKLEVPHALENAQTSGLPQTIIDALEVSRSVGLRYIWVDALCIIQDDDDDKAAIISKMGAIYGNSALTIVTSSNSDPTAGIPGVSRPRSQNQLSTTIQGMGVMIASHDTRLPQGDIEDSKWNSRAWTYQERVLSPRTVYFTESQMCFDCHHSNAFEDTVPVLDPEYKPLLVNEQTRFDSRMYDLWMRVWSDPTQYQYANKAFDIGDCIMSIISEDPDGPDGCSEDPAPIYRIKDVGSKTMDTPFVKGGTLWDMYKHGVRAYTKRLMTNPSDGVNAFLGIADVIRQGTNTTFWYGMPEFAFHQSLLWHPREPLKRRMKRGSDEPLFPSWAWAAWEGSVSYRGRGWYNAVAFPCSPALQWLQKIPQEKMIGYIMQAVRNGQKSREEANEMIKNTLGVKDILEELHNADVIHFDYEERGWVVERDETRNVHFYTHPEYPGVKFDYPIFLPDQTLTKLPTDAGTLFFQTRVAPVKFADMPNTHVVSGPAVDQFLQIGLNDEKRSANYRPPWQRIVYHQGYRAGFLSLNVPWDEVDVQSDQYYLAVISREGLSQIEEPTLNWDMFWKMDPQTVVRGLFGEERTRKDGMTMRLVEEPVGPKEQRPRNETGDPYWDEYRFGEVTLFDVYNVLLLKKDGRMHERVGVGKVNYCAFHCTKAERETVRLV